MTKKKSFLRRTISAVIFGNAAEEGTPCGFCPIHIFTEHEAGGVIHTHEGKAICARCRVLNGKMGSIIVADKPKRDAQLKAIDDKLQKEADKDALRIAEATQTATKTKRKFYK